MNKLIRNMSAIVILLIVLSIQQISSWTPDMIPKYKINTNDQEKLPMFFGNRTDYFKILDQDDATILIGARNAVYNISLISLIENRKQRIEWMSSVALKELCLLKGKQEADCQNYIRVFARVSESKIMICGTNSYKPYCRNYNLNSTGTGVYELVNEYEAQGRCPYDPTHNSTYIYTDGQLYSATVADFSGADALIYRETQRTDQLALKQLNQPAFVNAIDHNGYVFMFFREIAVEYMNCGKAIYSRVGRVCKNDKGGPHPFGDRWTTFLKTRLNCSIPGEYPFYFDEIQATTKLITGLYNSAANLNEQSRNSIIYAVLTTPVNAIGGSAVCAFSINEILNAFEGKFKSQKDTNSNWLPLEPDRVPEPRPGKCVDDSRTLPRASFNFVKVHSLMESAVPSLHGRPLLTRVSLQYRFSAIAVDPQVQTLAGTFYDVIYIGTDDGRIIKFINIMTPSTSKSNDQNSNSVGDGAEDESNRNGDGNSNSGSNGPAMDLKTIIITETPPLPHSMKITELTISKRTNSLIVIGTGNIISLSLNHCSSMNICRSCLNLQDPHCVWDTVNHECKTMTKSMLNNVEERSKSSQFIQDITGNKINELCAKYGDNQQSPSISHHQSNSLPMAPTRGKVVSTGSLPHTDYDDSRITLESIDDNQLKNEIEQRFQFGQEHFIINENDVNANKGLYTAQISTIIAAIALVFGILIGYYFSRKYSPDLNSQSFHGTEHRNQWNDKTRPILTQRNTSSLGKDVNLLVNTNQFQGTGVGSGAGINLHHLQASQIIKKDNLEHEFVVKDRSHECKNSNESLEKDCGGTGGNLGISKTGTLQKVKKTYV